MKNKYFISIVIIVLLFILFLMFIYNNKILDKFDNMEDNIYTFDSCCLEKEKENCMKYGKTGVCNYMKNNGSCFCQNSY